MSSAGDCRLFSERIFAAEPGLYSYHLHAGEEFSAIFEITGR